METPTGSYIDGYTPKIIEFFKTCVSNPGDLIQEWKAHASLLRNPEQAIEQCFMHFSQAGHTGKSLLAWFSGLPFGEFSDVIIHSKLTIRLSGEVDDNIKLHVEELKSSEYLNHDFASMIKERITPGPRKTERKHRGVEAVDYQQILSLNTNAPDWYGLVNATPEVLERLVILDFTTPRSTEEWQEIKRDLLISDSKRNQDIAFTIYTDLMKDELLDLHYFQSGSHESKGEARDYCETTKSGNGARINCFLV
jgi:hypothetical protein